MKVYILTFIVFFMWMQDNVDSVRIVELRVAAHMSEGGDALLGCRFDMDRDSLYSLKWYKDGNEFYRYEPKAVQPMKSFFLPGVNVDLNRSSVNVVALKHLTRDSTGMYRCEVRGEAPEFTTVSREKHVTIDLIPKSGPQVLGLQKEYHIGSHVDVNCTTSPSRPEAQLKWLINGVLAPVNHTHGPYLLLPTNRPHTYQAKLRLDFMVLPSHFDHQGAMTLKCQATIPPLYLQEIHYTFYEPNLRTTEPPAPTTTETNAGHTTTSKVLLLWTLQVLLVIFTYYQTIK